jgi:hypothetical protein
MKKIYCYVYLVCINLLTINFCILLGQTITQQLTVYVQPGVFPGIEGTYTYNELRQQYQQYAQNSNYYRNQAPSDPYSTRQAMQQATGLYLNMNVNGAQMSYGQAAHYNKRNEPWYTDHSRTEVNLSQCTYGQFIVYFVTHNYSEEQILDQYLLYMNNDFVHIAKQLPGYAEKIRALEHIWTKHKTWLDRACSRMSGSYIPGLAQRFRNLKQEADQEQKKTAARVRQEQEARQQKEAEELCMRTAEYCAKIDALCADDNNTTAIPCNHTQARHTAYTQIKTNAVSRTKKNYTVDAETINVAHAYDIQEQNLTTVCGNAYEHQLHTEFLEQLGEVRTISVYYKVSSSNLLLDAVGHSIAIGMEANRLQQPEVATTWANCGWQLLEIIEGIGEGVVQCIQNNVDMVLHPIHALTNMVHGLKTVTGYCLRAIGTAIRWDLAIELGQESLIRQEMDEIAAQIAACGTLLATTPPRDIAKQVTAVAADIVLVPKMFSLGSTLCSRATPLVEEAVAAIRDRVSNINSAIAHAIETARAESPVVQTTEGMLMRMSEELNKVGGAIAEVIKDSRLVLEAVCAQYAAEVGAELRQLRPLFDNQVKGFAEFANKYIKVDYEHILGMVLEFNHEGLLKFGGFHHDLMNTIEQGGAIQFLNKTVDRFGCYKADLLMCGKTFRDKSFFPANWSREQVVIKIHEAYDNFIKSGKKAVLEANRKYKIQGFTNEGIEIEMCITQKGLIKTAYPLLR